MAYVSSKSPQRNCAWTSPCRLSLPALTSHGIEYLVTPCCVLSMNVLSGPSSRPHRGHACSHQRPSSRPGDPGSWASHSPQVTQPAGRKAVGVLEPKQAGSRFSCSLEHVLDLSVHLCPAPLTHVPPSPDTHTHFFPVSAKLSDCSPSLQKTNMLRR